MVASAKTPPELPATQLRMLVSLIIKFKAAVGWARIPEGAAVVPKLVEARILDVHSGSRENRNPAQAGAQALEIQVAQIMTVAPDALITIPLVPDTSMPASPEASHPW